MSYLSLCVQVFLVCKYCYWRLRLSSMLMFTMLMQMHTSLSLLALIVAVETLSGSALGACLKADCRWMKNTTCSYQLRTCIFAPDECSWIPLMNRYACICTYITGLRPFCRWRFMCRVLPRPLSGAVGLQEWRSWTRVFDHWGNEKSSHHHDGSPWGHFHFLLLCPPPTGKTQGGANLCSLDQYPITFTYLVVLSVREAHRTVQMQHCSPLQPEGMCGGFAPHISQNLI